MFDNQSVPHYARAPITEAVIDLRTEVSPGVTAQDLKRLYAGEKDRYPTVQPLSTQHFSVEVGMGFATETRVEEKGWRYISADRKNICRIRIDGFTFSRLPPYEKWEALRDEARRLWQPYASFAAPKVLRVGLRYINRLDLPLPMRDLKDYLRIGPEVSSELPQAMSSFFMQCMLPQEDIEAMLVINEGLVPTEGQTDIASIMLDIDLFREANLPGGDAELWGVFELLRQRKNRVFESSITERVREMIR